MVPNNRPLNPDEKKLKFYGNSNYHCSISNNLFIQTYGSGGKKEENRSTNSKVGSKPTIFILQ